MTEQKGVLKRALDAIDTLTAQLAESEARAHEPIAVVGMSCRLPGGVKSPADYWALLREGRSGISEIPADRWDVDAFYDPDPQAEGKSYTKHGGFMDSIDTFDAPFFGISPREAVTLDPQHRLLLECSWEALENAGIAPDRLTNSATGVYIGITTSDYARLLQLSREDTDVYSASGTALNAAAGRISFALGLQGPSLAIDTACSSSLVAAHTAVQALRAHECDAALVGGVNVMATPDAFVLFSKWGMIAPSPECRTFDADANGFVRGEGCGVIVLKRVRDAVADGNRIIAVIRGSAVNQDGPSSGLSVPNGLAQAKVIRRALENAGLSPHDVGFVEAHGTGTVLGDPIEVEALGAVYGPDRSGNEPLMLGSVKPSIGHLESAAGVAGLIKLILTVQHGELPPQRNYARPNPRIDWDQMPIRVNDALRPWQNGTKPRIGAVSGFGFSGTNAHIIVEAAPQPVDVSEVPRAAQVLPLSARTDAALRESARRMAAALDGDDRLSLADVARTLSTGRAQLAHRAIVVGSDRAVVSARLADLARGEPAPGTRVGSVIERSAPRIAFLYTGQGAQYSAMGLELRDAFPVFREAFDGCDEILRSHGGPALLDVLRSAEQAERINDTAITQPALFALEYALTELFRSWGITPAAVLGHSVGEYPAACVAGVLPLENALRLIAERGRLMQALPAGGGMLAVAADVDTARNAAAAFSDRVSLAALNGPRDVVLSGDLEALRTIAAALKTDGIDSKPLTVSHAFHSPLMDPILEPFAALAGSFALQPPRVPLISNLTGAIDARAGASAEYWRRHVREPVAFEASMRHLVDDGFRVFLEIGPRPVLLGMARRFITTEGISWIPTMRARAGEAEDVLEAAGALFTVGARPDWERILDGVGRPVSLPTYPFQRKRHWVNVSASASAHEARRAERPGDHPLLGRRAASPLRETLFDCVLDPERRPMLREHRVAGIIIVPAAAFIELGHAAAKDVFGGAQVRLERGYLRSALILDDAAPRDVQLVVTPEGDGAASFEVFSRHDGVEGEWTSHAGGRMVRRTAAVLDSMDATRAHCTVPVDIDAYQQRMQDVGLEYGPSFRALSSAWRGERQAFGELRLPADDALATRLTAHPGLLDAAFHLIGLALPPDERELFYLPVGYESVEMTAPAGSEACAHVGLRSVDERTVVADIAVWRADGTPAVRVDGLQVRAVTREQFRAAIGAGAASALLRTAWRAAPAAQSTRRGRWLVMGGDSALAGAVIDQLRSAGAEAEHSDEGDALTVAERMRADAAHVPEGIIDLRTLTLPALTNVSPTAALSQSALAETLVLLRGLAAVPPAGSLRIVLPTLNAQGVMIDDAVEPMGAVVWGVAATAAAEVPALDVRLIDLDHAAAAGEIVGAALRSDGETRLAARGSTLFVPRLVPHSTPLDGEMMLPGGPYALTIHERGTLDGLGVRPAVRAAPGAGQVEIEVLASGLNFRDVLNLLDMYPGPAGPLGNECCGRIVAIDDGVGDLSVGDLVTCIADATLASHVVADAAMTFRVPRQLSVAQAAAFPIAQLTAYLALHHVGRIQPGDRVLIHAGAGGVGLAAVHLALDAGADVLASAGSDEKRDYLRALGVRVVFDSRHPASADEMRAATDGHGFDLLLNSLTGDFIDNGLHALAPGGSFLEIGLRELRSDDQVRAIRPDISYHALLLGDVCREQPAVVRAMYDALCKLLAAGRIPAPRVHEFPVAQSSAAFRYMARARHIGRVAITHPAAAQPRARRDASYLVTGGLGALGLHVAEWLAAQSAGRIMLMGRSAPGEGAMRRIEAMRAAGTNVEVVQGDVSNAADLAFPADPTRPPLRGVIHAAGIVDDAVLSRVDTVRLVRALRPKADGAHNLVRATADAALDFLVFFSSGSALLGSPGQATYGGANAFLDGYAHRLRSEGRAALSINWGAWGGSGMAATIDERTQREWSSRGIGTLAPDAALAMMSDALGRGLAQAAALPIEWPKFLRVLGTEAPMLLRDLAPRHVQTSAGDNVDVAGVSMREVLLALPQRERSAALADRLRRETAAVLGSNDPDDLELNAGLMEQGMDSLMSVELSGRLGRIFGVSLPATFTFEHPTLNALARHLLEQVAPAEVAATAPVQVDGIQITDTDVHGLSDDELEAELRRELDQAGF